MKNTQRRAWLPLGLLAMLLSDAPGAAQEWQPIGSAIAVQAMEKPTDEPWLPEFLRRLPHPPDQPRSLLQPGESDNEFACPPSNRRYLENDPFLEAIGVPPSGWFASAEVEAVAPHVFNQLVGTVTAGGRAPDTVALQNHGLNWTVAPRVELGYRLPSGFGGFSIAYRAMSSSGSSGAIGPDGLASLQSRVALNVADFDYQSWELTPNSFWTMRWRIGGRLAYVYYDSILSQSADTAAAGSGILQQRVTNMFTAFGPHAAVELTRDLWTPEWRFLSRIDAASTFGRIQQNVSESALDPTSASGTSFGQSPRSSSQTSPSISGMFGFDWRPPQWSSLDLFVGYQYEQWWNVGRYSTQSGFQRSRGDLTLNGIVLRLQFNY